MTQSHLVRVGVTGNVGRFFSADALRYPRGARVIVRTARGLEIGEVLAAADDGDRREADGPLLRRMTVEDDLLQARLVRNRDEAYEACATRIEQLALTVVLVDVEHLFDGSSLVFTFLGESSAELDAVTDELAELYDAKVQFRQFAEAVTQGCGPDCGTEDAEGAGCASCASGCKVADACGVARH